MRAAAARAAPFALLAALAGCAGCGRPAAPPHLPETALVGTDGATRSLGEIAAAAPFTVIVFFAAGCPVQRAHDARLRELFASYHPRGVAMVAVDAEATATPVADRDEARARSYPFPILTDPEGHAADALGATYATFTVVVGRDGRVRYRGGVDSDRSHVTPGASLWLRDALDKLLSGGEPDPAETTSLGCALRRR